MSDYGPTIRKILRVSQGGAARVVALVLRDAAHAAKPAQRREFSCVRGSSA
jgi:hypothetical protein